MEIILGLVLICLLGRLLFLIVPMFWGGLVNVVQYAFPQGKEKEVLLGLKKEEPNFFWRPHQALAYLALAGAGMWLVSYDTWFAALLFVFLTIRMLIMTSHRRWHVRAILDGEPNSSYLPAETWGEWGAQLSAEFAMAFLLMFMFTMATS